MIALIRNWLTSLTCAALAASLAEGLMPKGAVRQVGRLVCGMMLLWAALGPVLDMGISDLTHTMSGIRNAIADRHSVLEEQNDSMLKTLIERETAAYIVDKAAEGGIQCQAKVTCAADENGTWTPWSVQISGAFSDAQREQLALLVEDQLNIPYQRQKYTGGEQP